MNFKLGRRTELRFAKVTTLILLLIAAFIIIIIIIIIIMGFSVYLHNSPGDITQFNNKSMQKRKVLSCRLKLAVLVMD